MLHLKRGLAALLVAACCAIGTARADSGAVVNIGLTAPLSGGAAQYGADVQHGLQLAIDQLNAGGGTQVGSAKVTFKLDALDDQYHPNEAAINAKRLVQQDGAAVVFCPHSGGILALLGFNEKQSPKFLVGAYSSEPAILKQGDGSVMMIPPRYDAYFKPWATLTMQKFGKKLGLIPTTTAYGNAWKMGFSDMWKSMGGTVLSDNAVDYNTTADFSGVVTKALAEKPDVLLIGGPSQPTALVIKAAKDQGYKGGFIMMDQAKFEQVAKVVPLSQLDGTVGALPMDLYNGPGIKPFLAAYDKAYGTSREANSEIALNFMAMHIVAKAMQLAGTTSDPAAIRAKLADAVKELPKEDQPIGVLGISDAGHLRADVTSVEVVNGSYKRVPIPFLQ